MSFLDVLACGKDDGNIANSASGKPDTRDVLRGYNGRVDPDGLLAADLDNVTG
jgi:hypothetical protein